MPGVPKREKALSLEWSQAISCYTGIRFYLMCQEKQRGMLEVVREWVLGLCRGCVLGGRYSSEAVSPGLALWVGFEGRHLVAQLMTELLHEWRMTIYRWDFWKCFRDAGRSAMAGKERPWRFLV